MARIGRINSNGELPWDRSRADTWSSISHRPSPETVILPILPSCLAVAVVVFCKFERAMDHGDNGPIVFRYKISE